MTDVEILQGLADHLNSLIEGHHDLRSAVSRLIEERVPVPMSVADHPTVTVLVVNDTVQEYFQLGFLGLLNGISKTHHIRYCTDDDRSWFDVVADYDKPTNNC